MAVPHETLETQEERTAASGATGTSGAPIPGVIFAFASGKPGLVAVRLDRGELEIGRESITRLLADDDRASRRHVRIAFDDAAGGGTWTVTDLGSRNGVHVDGVRVDCAVSLAAPRVVRLGRTILLLVADVRRFEADAREVDAREADAIVGPTLRAAWQRIERAAGYGDALLCIGESGAGKELAARVFHKAASPRGPFIAVNCAAIPEGVAERLLFGAKKGAYSGAGEDAEGYLQAADGGTLFLDEIAELDLAVQSKLLRVLETREVLMLGSSRPRKVTIRVCSATHKDLRDEVRAGRFREDLFFRIGRPEVILPPLRERPEEIAWHVVREVASSGAKLDVHVTLVEACLLRHWPGNVRELRAEVRRAAHDAAGDDATCVEAKHLGERAGTAFATGGADAAGTASGVASAGGSTPGIPQPGTPAAPAMTRESVEEALRAARGNVTQAAKALGAHRTQLRRWLQKNAVDARSFGGEGESGEGGGGEG